VKFNTQIAILMMQRIALDRDPTCFSGLGVIFYSSPEDLPVIALGDVSRFPHQLPISDMNDIVRILTSISRMDSDWHDGFHLIDSRTMTLTHAAQFFAPVINDSVEVASVGVPVGARHMAALLGSASNAVDCIGLINSNGSIHIFENAHTVFSKISV
jgi:hypothetical protein